MKVKDQRYFSEPPKIRTPIEWRHKMKHCCFHRDYDHNIDECRTLKDEIEMLIHRGHLSRYVAKKGDQPKPIEEKAAEQSQDNRATVGVISTICSGEASTGNQETKPQSKKAQV